MRSRFLVAFTIAVPSFAIAPAEASFHLVKVREVFAGASAQPNAQYVTLQAFSAGQNFVAGHLVTVFDAAGNPVGSFRFPATVANGANQMTMLLATVEAQAYFNLTPDLVMTAVIPRAGGKVCWESLDCVSWGSYAGSATAPSPSGTPFAAGCGIPLDSAIRRDISRGNPLLLEAADDTDQSAGDFALAAPLPVNNAGMQGQAPAVKPDLLRNDLVSALAPVTPPLATIFTGTCGTDLVRLGANGVPDPGEGARTTTNGSSDDDDFYLAQVDPGVTDPDLGVLVDATRPLVFYQLDTLGVLSLVRSAGGGITFRF